MANNRELSQFASFVEVNDTSRHISVASTSGQYVGIGSTLPTVKVDIVGDVKVSGAFTASNKSSIGNFVITPVGSGATVGNSGIVTYYGDGSKLNLALNPSTGIGIGTTGGTVGYGVTFINFFGAGVSTAYYNSSVGIATIYFQGGGGGGGGAIGIGSTFPGTPASLDPVPANGDLFFHIDYGRTFIYYDEVTLGVGSSAFWIDSSPFNVGIITALTGGVSFGNGTAVSPSWYFADDVTTGVFSPVNGQQTFVSAGSSILNINPSGIIVTGVSTSTKTRVGAATTFTEDLVVQGSARITGILTVGSSSVTLDGTNNQINVGSGITIHSTNGVQVGSNTLHSTGLTINNINTSGIVTSSTFKVGTAVTINSSGITAGVITATSFVGDGSGLTGAGSTVADDTSTNSTFYPLFSSITTGTVTGTKVSTTKLTFNPSTGTLTATDLNSSSDSSLKENITTVEDALNKVNDLRGVKFNWKEDGRVSYGVIAQELEQVLPELVSDTDPKTVNYNGIIGVLIEAVKELTARVEELENKS